MSSPRSRITAAYAISVLLHLILLLVLALLPEIETTADAAPDPQAAPMEVVLQPEPASTPEPAPSPAEAATPTPAPTPEPSKETKPLKTKLTPVVPAPNVLHTQMDPANLKRADKAPEHATFVASYNSVATKPKPRPLSAQLKPGASATPKPVEADVAKLEQALLKRAGMPQEVEPVVPKPTPLPHPAATAPFFRTSLPKPTPLGSATPTPSQPAASPAVTPAPTPKPSPTPPAASGSAGVLAGEMPAEQSGDDAEVGVDAVGNWNKAVGNAVGSCWNFYRQSKADTMGIGEVVVEFTLDAKRQISEISVLSNTANPNNAMYAVRSVREAELPPIPPERIARNLSGRFTFVLTLTILPTK